MSGGRVELGLGAGWFDGEHRAYGIPFPDVRTRFDRLEEQLAIVTGLWSTPTGDRFSYSGAEYVVEDSPALPKPVQDRIPVIIGGHGPRRTPRLAATYATEFNLPFHALDEGREQFLRVRQTCETLGRDPSSLTYSNALVTAVGRRRRRGGASAGEHRAHPREARDQRPGGHPRRGARPARGVARRRVGAGLPADPRPRRPRPPRADRGRGRRPRL